MRNLTLIIGGIAIGFIAAHCINQNPEGRRFFERVNQGAREFSGAVASGYRDGEAEAADSGDDVERALRNLKTTG